MSLPLTGLKVLDLTRVLAGPWATMSLGDLGATVWKIENVDGGDDTRAWSVPSYRGVSTYYLCTNRGKRSLAIDLKSPTGIEIVRGLARQADVVVENFRAGTAEGLGLGYEALRQENTSLIYCSISGYGKNSPDARRPGYDIVVQAESGLMSITGDKDGPPQRFGVAICDIACGMISAQAILAALFERQRTGRGQLIDISLHQCGLNLLINVGSGFLNAGQQSERFGNAHPTVVPYQLFDCLDGSFILAVGNDKQFRSLCKNVIARPDLAADARFATAKARAENRQALLDIMVPIFAAGGREKWIAACMEAEVPAGVVKTVSEAFSPANGASEHVHTLHSDLIGPVTLVRPAHGIAAQQDATYSAPPLLGQDTREVLKSVLGYGDDEIDRFVKAGEIAEIPS